MITKYEIYYKVSTGHKYYSGNNEWKEDVRYFSDFYVAHRCYLENWPKSTLSVLTVSVDEIEDAIMDYEDLIKAKNDYDTRLDCKNNLLGEKL